MDETIKSIGENDVRFGFYHAWFGFNFTMCNSSLEVIGGEVMIKLLMIIFIKELFLPKYNISKHINRKGEQLIYVPKYCIILKCSTNGSWLSNKFCIIIERSWLSSKFCIIIERIMTQQPKNKCILIKALFLCPITCIVFVTNFFECRPVFVFSIFISKRTFVNLKILILIEYFLLAKLIWGQEKEN